MSHQQTASNDGQTELARGLSSRHVLLMALGGAVGTGLFLATAEALKTTGPSILLGYAVAGFIAFLIMRQLGEMVVEEPVAGSFSHFAYKYWGEGAGFITGWNYWVLNILVSMAELAAVGQYMLFWFPDLPVWITVCVCFVLINMLNFVNVKVVGETEFWFSLIKVAAVVCMILFGIYLLVSGKGGEQARFSNLWSHGNFFAGGIAGFVIALVPILFSFGGLELLGIAAAETSEPKKVIPSVIKQAITLIMFFYIGLIAVLLWLFPWTELITGGSPFVMIFSKMNSNVIANVLNLIVLSAALSVYHASFYGSTRMLFSLSEQRNAPHFLSKLSKSGVPFGAVSVSALATFSCVVVNFLFPEKAFGMLMSLVVAALIICWTALSFTHLKFRAAMKKQNIKTSFKAFFSPIGNYICLGAMLLIIGVFIATGQWTFVIIIPIWLSFLGGLFLYKQKYGFK